jgi:hypothetical protein
MFNIDITSNQGKVEYATGDVYSGSLVDGRFAGSGRYIYRPIGHFRASYEGDFEKGRPHGHGTRVFADKSKFDGQMREGEMQGHGIMIWGGGDQYIGQWTQGRPHGQGVKVMKHGDKYEGQLYKGVPYGAWTRIQFIKE